MFLEKNIKQASHAWMGWCLVAAFISTAQPSQANTALPKESSESETLDAYDGLCGGWSRQKRSFTVSIFWSMYFPIGPPLIGPTFDLEDPDEAYLLSDALTGTIGYGYKEETTPPLGSFIVRLACSLD